jgi:glycosyltransferase involved in cell wall biosynthesis
VARRDKLRIALVGLTFPFRGGISHYTTLLCRALSRKHEVRFYALYRQYPRLLFPGQTQTDRSSAPFEVPHLACIDSINPYTWLATAIRIARYKPDVILFSWWHPFFAPAFGTIAHLAKLLVGIPSCYLCHNALPHERTRIDRVLLRYVFSSGQVFITHSRQDYEDLQAFRPGAIVRQNPHPTYDVFAADEALPGPAAKQKLGLQGKRVLLFFGFIRGYKGLNVLLEAMDGLSGDDGYQLVIVGEFYDDRALYHERLEALKRRGQLTLVDRYVPNEEVPLYFSAADLVMVPYLSATQSGVIQIAYAFKKPVVATTVGGIPEVVTDGGTGYLVPPGDARAMTEAVRRYFKSASRERFEENITRENEKYSWDRMVETVEEVCHEAQCHHSHS